MDENPAVFVENALRLLNLNDDISQSPNGTQINSIDLHMGLRDANGDTEYVGPVADPNTKELIRRGKLNGLVPVDMYSATGLNADGSPAVITDDAGSDGSSQTSYLTRDEFLKHLDNTLKYQVFPGSSAFAAQYKFYEDLASSPDTTAKAQAKSQLESLDRLSDQSNKIKALYSYLAKTGKPDGARKLTEAINAYSGDPVAFNQLLNQAFTDASLNINADLQNQTDSKNNLTELNTAYRQNLTNQENAAALAETTANAFPDSEESINFLATEQAVIRLETDLFPQALEYYQTIGGLPEASETDMQELQPVENTNAIYEWVADNKGLAVSLGIMASPAIVAGTVKLAAPAAIASSIARLGQLAYNGKNGKKIAAFLKNQVTKDASIVVPTAGTIPRRVASPKKVAFRAGALGVLGSLFVGNDEPTVEEAIDKYESLALQVSKEQQRLNNINPNSKAGKRAIALREKSISAKQEKLNVLKSAIVSSYVEDQPNSDGAEELALARYANGNNTALLNMALETSKYDTESSDALLKDILDGSLSFSNDEITAVQNLFRNADIQNVSDINKLSVNKRILSKAALLFIEQTGGADATRLNNLKTELDQLIDYGLTETDIRLSEIEASAGKFQAEALAKRAESNILKGGKLADSTTEIYGEFGDTVTKAFESLDEVTTEDQANTYVNERMRGAIGPALRRIAEEIRVTRGGPNSIAAQDANQALLSKAIRILANSNGPSGFWRDITSMPDTQDITANDPTGAYIRPRFVGGKVKDFEVFSVEDNKTPINRIVTVQDLIKFANAAPDQINLYANQIKGS